MARSDRQGLSHANARGDAPLGAPPRVVVAYGSTFGTTEEIARRVVDGLEARIGRRPLLADVAWTDMAEIVRHDVLVLGSSTWDVGQLQPDWDAAVGALEASDLRGRRVAVFGCGDRAGYPETFGDALGVLRGHACKAGAELIGALPMRSLGFDPDTFEAHEVRDGDDLVGLILDDEEDDAARAAHVDAWCELLAREIGDAVPRRSRGTAGDDARCDAERAERAAIHRRLLRRTLADLLACHSGARAVLRDHGMDLRTALRHELAQGVPLRVLIGPLCPVDDREATLEALVAHVYERSVDRDRCAAEAPTEV